MDRDGETALPGRDDLMAGLSQLLAGGGRPAVYLVSVRGHDDLVERDPDGTGSAMRETGVRLDRLVRNSDLLASTAPGTFVVVGSGVSPDAAGALVERIEGAVALPLEIGGDLVSLTADIGLVFAASGSSAEDLLARAEDDLDRSRRRP